MQNNCQWCDVFWLICRSRAKRMVAFARLDELRDLKVRCIALQTPGAGILEGNLGLAAGLLGENAYKARGAMRVVGAGKIGAVDIEGEQIALSNDGKQVALACIRINGITEAAEQCYQRVSLI